MIGVAPATHMLVLSGFIIIGLMVVISVAHNHWLHAKNRKVLAQWKKEDEGGSTT